MNRTNSRRQGVIRRFALGTTVLATGTAAALALSAGVASAATNTITIPLQGGNNKTNLNPGGLMYAGYDFTFISGATIAFQNAQAILSVSCLDHSAPTQSSVTIPMSGGPYDGSQNSQGWVPSGDQGSSLVYQGNLAMPNLCNGGTMVVGEQMGPFTADVFSATAVDSINVRWHYGPASDVGANGSSWSATKSVTPAVDSGLSQAPLLGGWAPIGIAGVFLAGAGGGALVWRQRRRTHACAPEGS